MKLKLSLSTAQWLQNNNYNPENLNQPGENGDTALIKATKEGNLEIVWELIADGAELNIRNNDGNNALWFACFANHFELINLLIDGGINIDNQNDNGATALMYVASAGKTELVKLLLQKGANSQLKNLDDFRAVDFASTLETLAILLERKLTKISN